MTDKTRKRIGAAALCLGFAVLYALWVLTAIHHTGTDAELYHAEQTRAGILPTAGISDGELQALDHRLADYLSGHPQALESSPPFNDREMAHMRDCFDLFALLRKVRGRLIPWAVALILGGAWLLQDRRRARRCAWLSPLILLIPLGAFAVYAVADFDAAFTFFHRILFRNDLWLLDPRTDLLIRICPESMFMRMGARIGAYSLTGMVAVPAAATALSFLWPKRREDNTWNNRDMRRASASKRIDFKKKGTR